MARQPLGQVCAATAVGGLGLRTKGHRARPCRRLSTAARSQRSVCANAGRGLVERSARLGDYQDCVPTKTLGHQCSYGFREDRADSAGRLVADIAQVNDRVSISFEELAKGVL